MNEITREEMKERLGNVDQIRDLLFGRKMKDYEQRFDICEERLDKLETELSQFQLEIRDRLDKVQESLSQEIRSGLDSLEKKLKYLSLTTHEETSKLQQEIDLLDRKYSHSTDSLSKTVNTNVSFLKNELAQTRESLEEDIRGMRNQFFEELEKELSNLQETKISRTDFAEVLFELCLKIKGTEFVPNLKEASENHVKTEFLLPEQQSNSESSN